MIKTPFTQSDIVNSNCGLRMLLHSENTFPSHLNLNRGSPIGGSVVSPNKTNSLIYYHHCLLLSLLVRCFSRIFISVHVSSKQFLFFLFVFLLFSQFSSPDAYVYRQKGRNQSFLHKRLMGRQRREAQREILTTLGLSHRPRAQSARNMEISSAPLYMLGLYSTASNLRSRNLPHFPLSEDEFRGQTASENQTQHVSRHYIDREEYDLPHKISTDLNRQIEDSGILSNEIGTLVTNSNLDLISDDGANSGLLFSPEEERRLLERSDVVISYINTKQQPGTGAFQSTDSVDSSRSSSRRHRSFHFETSQTSSNDRLQFARFRLYKERSDDSLGNQTLRVEVYQTLPSQHGRMRVSLLGTRLVDSSQEGWLVYDVTTVLQDWIRRPETNLGIKVTVETIQGRFLKPTRTGVVGRRGSASKQAFIVAFFIQDTPELLRLNVRRRYRRNAAANLRNALDSDETEPEADTGNTNDEADEENALDDVDSDDFDATTNSTNSEGESDSRMMTKRKTKEGKPRKKGRKRNRPKNSSKRKPMLEHCQRKQFYVDFKDLGWHTWIIAPKAYKAYQCHGTCKFPLNAGLNATNHAIVQSLVHVRLQSLHIPEPCCVPSELEPLEILFFSDETKVIYKKYRDMVVSACGCH